MNQRSVANAAIVAAIMLAVGHVLADSVAGVRFEEVTDVVSGDETVTTLAPSTTHTVARAVFTYGIDLPTWVPPGYAMEEDAIVTDFSEGTLVEVFWRDASQTAVVLQVYKDAADTPFDVAAGSTEEMTIAGLPIAVTKGAWSEDGALWNGSPIVTLTWSQGEDIYSLVGSIESDLSRVAASTPHFQ